MAHKRTSKPKTSAQGVDAADAVDEQLARYRSMRDFGVTAEPAGGHKASGGGKLPFVIQKHAASHLHYDFRLGWNGVLKSWAVAKGPSYYTGDKRLAVQVEDHPMEYGGFEGIIPAGQYGGGTVMVWDQGTWEPQEGNTDVDEGLRVGSLKFVMHGTKMQGKWTLVRMGGKAATERKPNWLLIKEHDEFERTKDAPCITDEASTSAVTGRTLEEIAGNEDHVWNSKETAKPGQAWYRKAAMPSPLNKKRHLGNQRSEKQVQQRWLKQAPELADAPREALPEFIAPQLAAQATVAPAGEGWLHELKLDGYRMQARKDGPKVQMLTRTGLDWTHRMKAIAEAVAALPMESAVLDGEVVVLAEDGTTSFADLQAAFQEGVRKPLTYFVFDLLHVDGRNLRGLPLVRRKAMLAGLLEGAGESVRLSEHLETSGEMMFHKACELRAEGIISKKADSTYTAGRSEHWLKLKCVHEQEFVIGGFTLPEKGRKGTQAIGALLLGYYNDAGKLIYAGRTGTGFTAKTHGTMRAMMEARRQAACPFERPPAEARKGAIWVKPELVAQVNFATWTAEDLLRQASFKGLREDKPAKEVRREEAKMQPRGTREAANSAQEKSISRSEPSLRMEPRSTGHPVVAAEAALKRASVRLTHPEKVLDAASGLTKQQLADYYWAVAARMLPQIAGRPLSLVRCPEGSEKPCFYQKHKNHMLPPGIESIDVVDKKTGKPEPYITLSNAEALAGLAQMGVLEVHPWGSRNDDLERPDRITIDLDPDEAIAWVTLAGSATEVRKRLKALGLESFLKTTGGKGLHVVVPVQPEHDWTVVKQFAHAFVLAMEKEKPSMYLTKMTKAARKGRIYLDYLRNERGATAVAAYSPRARAGAPVSLPLSWTDLKLGERPVFRAADVGSWKARLGKDPWKQMGAMNQRIRAEVLTGYRITV